MFGIGKERTPGAPQKDLGQDVIDMVTEAYTTNAQAFAKLPDYLIARFGDLKNLVSEYNLLKATKAKMKLPSQQREVYSQRISLIKNQLIGLRRIADAIRIGYEPYELPSDFYVGSVNEQEEHETFRISRGLRVPLSEEVLEKYERARKDGTFDIILAGSADTNIFYWISSINSKYLLIGFVPTGDGPVSYGEKRENDKSYGELIPGLKAPNVTGFLISNSALRERKLAIAS